MMTNYEIMFRAIMQHPIDKLNNLLLKVSANAFSKKKEEVCIRMFPSVNWWVLGF